MARRAPRNGGEHGKTGQDGSREAGKKGTAGVRRVASKQCMLSGSAPHDNAGSGVARVTTFKSLLSHMGANFVYIYI